MAGAARGGSPVVASRDPIVVADDHWKQLGCDTGWHFRASLSIYSVDDLIRERDEASLRPYRLTRSKHEALAVLYFSRHGEMPLGTLGAHLLVHPTSVTTTVDVLERRGLVRRVGHPTDRRATLARITPKGRRAMQDSSRAIAAHRSGVGALSDADAARLFDVLARVRADAGDLKRPNGDPDSPTDPTAPVEDPILVGERNWEREGWAAGPWFRAAVSVYRVSELIRQTNDAALRPFRLTHVRHEALAVLYFSHAGEMPMGKLGERLLVHPTSVTTTVDTLQGLGYVRRVPHPSDRRATLARITPKGQRAVEASIRSMADVRCGVGALTDAQARTVFRLLTKVRLGGTQPSSS
jgi:DNA-binding MarR family transcriptional regulator